jgi:hypothetical protein
MSENTAQCEGRIILNSEGILMIIKDQYKESIIPDCEGILINIKTVLHQMVRAF